MKATQILAPLLGAAVMMSCAQTPGGQAPAATETAAETSSSSGEPALLQAHQALHQALASGDVEGVVALLDHSPKLLIFHPLLEDRFDSVETVRRKLPLMFEHLGAATWTEVHAEAVQVGDSGWITSNLLIESPALPAPFRGRGTEIWVKENDGWRLIHAHWSEVPSRAEPVS